MNVSSKANTGTEVNITAEPMLFWVTMSNDILNSVPLPDPGPKESMAMVR